jgi:integrase/recombinase XerD
MQIERVFFMLIMDCIDEFRVDCELRRLSQRTIKGYINNNLQFAEYLENEFEIDSIEEVKPAHIKNYVLFLTQTDRKPTYINGILKCIRAFFKYCYNEEFIERNPATKVPWQKEGTVLIETFTDDEVKRLLDAFDYSTYLQARNKLIMALAFDTGVRNTEMCNILNCDIHDKTILIHGKGNKERNVSISPYLQKVMLRYERMKAVFFKNKILKYQNYLLSRTAMPLTKEAMEFIFNQANKIAMVRPEVRCSPHTARHYFAQANLRNGLDVYSLSRLMGHCSVNITKTYLQSLKDEEIVKLACMSSPLMNLKR